MQGVQAQEEQVCIHKTLQFSVKYMFISFTADMHEMRSPARKFQDEMLIVYYEIKKMNCFGEVHY